MTIDIKNKTWYCNKYGNLGHILIPDFTINHRVLEMSIEIAREYEYKTKDLICIIILEGATIFATDLLRNISMSGIHPKIYTIAIKSYKGTKKQESHIWTNISSFRPTDLKDKYILLIEDIIDTGKTINYLYNIFSHKTYNPKDISVCSLLNKRTYKRIELPDKLQLKFIGFNIPDVFVIGYGLDYNNKYRNLPFISIYQEDEQKYEKSILS